MQIDTVMPSPPAVLPQTSAEFAAEVESFMHEIDGDKKDGNDAVAAVAAQPTVAAQPASAQPAGQHEEETGVGGDDAHEDDDEEDDELDVGEEAEDEAEEVARFAAFVKEKRAIMQEAAGINIIITESTVKAIIELKSELTDANINSISDLKNVLQLTDGTKMTVKMVRDLVKEHKRGAYDAPLPNQSQV